MPKAKVFSIENQKGGVAKTTTAVTIAVWVAHKLEGSGARVLIIDTDPQGDVATALGVDPGNSCLSQLLLEQRPFSEVMMPADLSHLGGPSRPNLYLLPADYRLFDAQKRILDDLAAMQEMADKMTPSMRRQSGLDKIPSMSDIFNEVLTPLKQAFDYIFIDCPPSLGFLREAVHIYADYAIVPVKPDFHSVIQTSAHTQTIATDRRLHNATIQILTIVPTMVQANHNLTREMYAQLRERYGKQLLSAPVPMLTGVAQGPALGGLTIFDHDPTSAAAVAYRYLGERVMTAA